MTSGPPSGSDLHSLNDGPAGIPRPGRHHRARPEPITVIVFAPAPSPTTVTSHLRKIVGPWSGPYLADEVLVVAPGGNVGRSTSREGAYTEERGKPVTFISRREQR